MNLNLDWTFEYCEQMWKWVSEEWEKNGGSLRGLKTQWLLDHDFNPDDVNLLCFFCDFSPNNETNETCDHCPGKIHDCEWSCYNGLFCWEGKPTLFYKEVVRLHNLYKESKK